jgi:hypothetical protein
MFSSILLFVILLLSDVMKYPSIFYTSSAKMRYETLPVLDTMIDNVAQSQKNGGIFNISAFFKVPPSVSQWNTLEDGQYGISILSMRVDHHSDSPWYIPTLHNRHSAGWNRTRESGFNTRPYACSLRFIGVGLESTLEGFQQGGTGYITLGYKDTADHRQYWHGFDKNDTNKVFCYYITNKDTGSEFLVRNGSTTSFFILFLPLNFSSTGQAQNTRTRYLLSYPIR